MRNSIPYAFRAFALRGLTWARGKSANIFGGRSLVSNMMFLGTSRICAISVNLVITSHLAKVLGPANFGINIFAISYIACFLTIVNLGYDTYLTREIAYRPARMRVLVGSAIGVRLLLASIIALLVFGSLFLMDLSALGKLVVLIQASTLFSSAINLSFVYQGLQRMQVLAGRDILGNLCSLLGVLLLVHEPADLPIAAIIGAGAVTLTNVLVLWQYGNEFGHPHIYWPRHFDLAHAGRSMSYFWIMLMITINYSTPIVLLGLMRSETEVGLFSAGWKLLTFTITVPTVFSALFLPRFAKLNSHRVERLTLARTFMEVILAWAIPVSLLGVALTPQMLLVLFGASFSNSSTVVCLLLMNALVISSNIGFSTPLLAGTRQKELFRITAAGMVTGTLLNLLLIPAWGIDGAALAALFNECLMLMLFAVHRPEVPLSATMSFALRCLSAALPAAVVSYLVSQLAPISASPFLSLITGGVAGGVVYLILLWPMRISVVRLAAGLWQVR